MSRQIWKYSLETVDGDQAVEMPAAASVVAVGSQRGCLCIWVDVDAPSVANETRTFRVLGTGQRVPERFRHVGTAIIEPFVWHVFEEDSQ